jgi:hypothetical protein
MCRRRMFSAYAKHNSRILMIKTKYLLNLESSLAYLVPYEHLVIRALARIEDCYG